MKNKLNLFQSIFTVLLTVSAIIVVITAFADFRLFLASAALWMGAFIFMMVRLNHISRDITDYLEHMGQMLADVQSASLTEYPISVLVAKGNKEIVWYNSICREQVLEDKPYWGRSLGEFLPDIPMDAPCPPDGYDVELSGKLYTVFVIVAQRNNESMYVLYFIDDNDLKVVSQRFDDTRPSVIIMSIDNYDEMFQGAKENERGITMGHIEEIIEKFALDNRAMMRKISRDAYLFVIEEQHMKGVLEERFALLDSIREIQTANKITPTMSIGVGRQGEDFHVLEQMARQSLDMALGRGGDQAAIKTKNGYEFYGGRSKAIERRNKVRTRVIASAMSEIIGSSDNVLIMGHRMADLDCLGSAAGFYRALEQMGKTAHIVMNTKTELTGALHDYLLENGYEGKIISPEQALSMVNKDTLLIVVDTHVRHVMESSELYEACRNVIVVDHHRKMVGHIENAVIFYHEPYSSSASEMVSEVIQYLEGVKITAVEANALMAGMTLDTHNFTMRTNVRTFESAAYLRRMGADTTRVRSFFASTIDDYRSRSNLVCTAEMYRDCAISLAQEPASEIQVTSAQAADELMSIAGVKASFVIYPIEGGISISARSMGKVNVQLIMEKLSGGGHQTMAGSQIADIDVDRARLLLISAIDQYFEESSKQKS